MSTLQGIATPDRTENDRPPGGLDSFLLIVARARDLARPPVQAALWQQVQRGALDLGWLTFVIGSLAGAFTVATIEAGFGLGANLAVRVLTALVLGQLAGFVSALLLVAGPATAATFELGLMRQHGEMRTLRLIGVDPRAYLMLPRVLGFAVSLLVLTFIFQLASAVGGFALAALVTPISFTQQITTLSGSLAPGMLVMTGLRSLLLGAAIGVLVCEHGFSPAFSPARMPQVARQLLSRSLVAIVVVHGGFALLLS
ncbi:MAG TPA: ABC transporter permease [Candidatus Didemnitutus sp.]|jgi:phospholipid/cholesterol/gamma-HCH transport system permease protein